MKAPVAIVTGAGRGIGWAIAERLVSLGYSVAAADLDAGRAAEVVRDTPGFGSLLDVTDAGRFEEFVAEAEARLGPVDVLVNNAGVMTVGPFLEQDPAVVRRQFEVNVFGVINGMRAVLPGMLSRSRGHIVNIGSAASKIGIPGESTYSATKHAVLGLTEAVRGEFRGRGIDFSVVMPAVVDTALAVGTRTSKGVTRLRPEDVADAVVATLRRPRFEVYVPRRLAVPIALGNVTPRPLRDTLARASGTHRVALGTDASHRAAYEDELARQAQAESTNGRESS